MASTPAQLFRAFQASFASQTTLLERERDRERNRVVAKYATGSASISSLVNLDVPFRLVFVRCHFGGGSGTAAMTLDVNSFRGLMYGTHLKTITAVGTGADASFTPGGADIFDPSAWSFQSGDQLRIKWTNPDSGNMTWGLEVGLAISA